MAITRLQTTERSLANGTASPWVMPAFAAPSSAGSLVVVFVRHASTADAVTGVTDNQGNSYTRFAYQKETPTTTALWGYYAQNIAGGASHTITVTTSASAQFSWVYALEYSGAATASVLDVAVSNTESGTTFDSVPFSTTQAGSLVLVAASNGAIAIWSAGTNFTLVDGTIQCNGINCGGVEEYIPAGMLSSYSARFNVNDPTAGAMLVGVFKPAPTTTIVTTTGTTAGLATVQGAARARVATTGATTGTVLVQGAATARAATVGLSAASSTALALSGTTAAAAASVGLASGQSTAAAVSVTRVRVSAVGTASGTSTGVTYSLPLTGSAVFVRAGLAGCMTVTAAGLVPRTTVTDAGLLVVIGGS